MFAVFPPKSGNPIISHWEAHCLGREGCIFLDQWFSRALLGCVEREGLLPRPSVLGHDGHVKRERA